MKKLVRLLKNKKVATALTTTAVAIGAKLGLEVDGEVVALVVAAGVTVLTALTVTERKTKARSKPDGTA